MFQYSGLCYKGGCYISAGIFFILFNRLMDIHNMFNFCLYAEFILFESLWENSIVLPLTLCCKLLCGDHTPLTMEWHGYENISFYVPCSELYAPIKVYTFCLCYNQLATSRLRDDYHAFLLLPIISFNQIEPAIFFIFNNQNKFCAS